MIKRAVGYDSTEITEEYQEDSDGNVRMTKRKVVSKNVPPDVSALKLLVELDDVGNLSNFTDEELEKEKQRLLSELKKMEEENNGT